jgi:lipopolysaccharide biosynthesis protein
VTAPRLLALHLPQFHPTPENDEWWGPGFTEWTNVAKARARFPGHYQPHLPGELGFYDLRLRETREAQAALARDHGIFGFVYYHYWFHGKRLLHRPIDDIVKLGEPDFPFCLCWANENWARTWGGRGLDSETLITQSYSPADDREHIRWLLPLFADPRYVKIDGKPVFFIYRASRLPEARRTFDLWREEAVKFGLPGLYFIRFETHGEVGEPALLGMDAAAEFQPDRRFLGREVPEQLPMQLLRRLRALPPPLDSTTLRRYESLVDAALNRDLPSYRLYRGVTPGWDNTPRRADGLRGGWLTLGNTPERYARWLRGVLERFEPYSPEENLVLVNAWNEWAEGNHLEPCRRWGRGFLEATRNEVLARNASPSAAARPRLK